MYDHQAQGSTDVVLLRLTTGTLFAVSGRLLLNQVTVLVCEAWQGSAMRRRRLR